jgi:LPS-assembly lipoprotein
MKIRKLVLGILLPVILVSCGFQLRGEQTLPFSKLAITGSSSYVTVAQLHQSVALAPTTRVVSSPGEADATLYILSENRDRVITALNATGRVREYELRLRVTFRLVDKSGRDLIPASEIMLFRLLPYDESQVLSKGEEEALLYRDMHTDIAAQIMRRLAAAKPIT